MKRRLLVLVLMVLMGNTWANTDVWIGSLYYSLNISDHTATVKRPDSWGGVNLSRVDIPAMVSYNSIYYSVTSIGEHAFEGCTQLATVTIGANITNIGSESFHNCPNLNFVELFANEPPFLNPFAFDVPYDFDVMVPSQALDAYEHQLNWTRVTFVHFGPIISYTEQGSTLYYCLDESEHTAMVVYPNYPRGNVSGPWAGYTKPTGNVVIPNRISYDGQYYNVTKIGRRALQNCTGIDNITIGENIAEIAGSAFKGCMFSTIHFDATNCTSMSYYLTPSLLVNEYYSVFHDCRSTLTHVYIGNNVTNIPAYAFARLFRLYAISLPSSVVSIGEGAFRNCTEMYSVDLSSNLETIGNYAFEGCTGIDRFLHIPQSVQSMGTGVFKDCTSLPAVLLYNERVPSRTFENCTALEEVRILNNVKSIGDAFKGCPNIHIVRFYAQNCEQMYAERSNGASTYRTSVFIDSRSSLNEVTIYNSATKIPAYAFHNCNQITEVDFGSHLLSIGDHAFDGCNLARIDVESTTPPTVYAHSFDYSGDTYLSVPSSAYTTYRNHTYWGQFNMAFLSVGGVAVTHDNANCIHGVGISGSVSYNYQNNTLTLNNVYLFGQIESWSRDLKINLIGNNTISALYEDGLLLHYSSTIQGSGSLSVSSQRNGIYCASDLNIEGGCSLTVSGDTEGDYSSVRGMSGKKLRVNESRLVAVQGGSSQGSISGFDALELTQCAVNQPIGAVWNATDHRFEDASGNVITGQIVIDKTEYNLWVRGVRVGDTNAADVLGNGGVSYEPSTKTLTLHNVNLTSYDVIGIHSMIDGLKIYLLGENYIHVSNDVGILSEVGAALTIYGSGRLVVKGLTAIGVYDDLVISNGCIVDAISLGNLNHSAIEGYGDQATFTLNMAAVNAQAYSAQGIIYGFNSFSCTGGSDFVKPAGAQWCNTHHRIENASGEVLTGEVNFDWNLYDLYVEGVRVTGSKLNDVLGDRKVSYDPDNKILTLNNASIYNTESNVDGIAIGIDGVKIELLGENTIHAGSDGISMGAVSTTIRGSGTLSIYAPYGIFSPSASGHTLTIMDGCYVDIHGSQYGISFPSGTLAVDHARLRANGTSRSVACGALSMNHVSIVEPTGGYHSNGYIRNYNGNIVGNADVVIDELTYNLYVAGTQVTLNNQSNVLGDGHVSYEPSTKTLTLHDANIQYLGSSNNGIQSGIAGLKIDLQGTNTIDAGNSAVMLDAIGATFTGRGSLSMTGRYGVKLNSANGKTLTFTDGCHVDIDATQTGIDFGSNRLVVERAELRSKGQNYPLSGHSLTMNEVDITYPGGAYFANSYVRYSDGNVVCGEYVVITADPYNLWVKGTRVSPFNRVDVFENGQVNYDPSDNVLTLNNATITTSAAMGIQNSIAGLTLRVEGTNNINVNSNSNTGIYTSTDLVIEGIYGSELNVTGANGIKAFNCNLTIQGGVMVNATGVNNTSSYSGIQGSSNKTFTIINSSVTAQKQVPSSGSIVGYPISGFQPQLTGCSITSPEGATWSSGRYVDADNASITDPIVISLVDYDIIVAGIRVNIANCTDVMRDGRATHPASVSFDPSTDELTLNNAHINATSVRGIRVERPNVKINLVGYNVVQSDASGISSNKSFVIQGSGELDVTGTTAIRAQTCNLAINGVTKLTARGTGGSGYASIEGDPTYTLTINRAHVVAYTTSNSMGTIACFSNLQFTDNKVQFVEPANAVYTSGSVKVNGSTYHGRVEIAGIPYGLLVNGEEVTSANCEDFRYGVESGHISYNPLTYTLTLDNAVFGPHDMGAYGIENYDVESLKIQLVGDSRITGNNGDGFTLYTFALEQGDGATLTIIGPGTLYCAGGVDFEGDGQCNFKIHDDADVYFDYDFGNSYAASSQVWLDVMNSTLRARHFYALLGLNENEGNAYYTIPEDAGFDSSVGYGSMTVNGVMPDEVVIYTGYFLNVAGVHVNSRNAHHFVSPYLTDGTVDYDAITRTLILDHVNIAMPTGSSVDASFYPLNVTLVGDNFIGSTDSYGIYSIYSLAINGQGSLVVEADRGIATINGSLQFTGGCSVSVTSMGSGAKTAVYGLQTLLVDSGCYLFAQNSGLSDYSPIYGFSALQLNEVEMLQPIGGVYNGSTGHRRLEDQQGNLLNAPVEIGYVDYDLWICNQRVTSANVHNLSSLSGVSGAVSFNPSTNTLTLNNATLAFEGDHVIRNQIEGLVIRLVGTNRIENDYGKGLYIEDATTTLTGNGTLTFAVDVAYIYALDMGDKRLTIEDGCTVNSVYNNDYGIHTDGTLRINNANLDVLADDPIGAANLILDYVSITTPAGGSFDATTGRVVDAQGNAVTHVVIEPIIYDLWVADVEVTAVNADDVFGDGTVSYDAENKVLTLTNADLSDAEYGILTYIPDLVINLIGTNTIDAFEDGLSLYDNTTITGGGTLDITAPYGIYAYDDDIRYPSLTIEGVSTVTVTSRASGVFLGNDDSFMGGTLTVDHAVLDVTTNGVYCIGCLGFVMTDTEISIPTGGYFQGCHVRDANGNVACGHVAITPVTYDLWVTGIQVTAINAHDVLSDQGSVVYDVENGILTLTDATLLGENDEAGIMSYIEDLEIVLVGTNTINSTDDGIGLYANATISGSGTLSIVASFGIYGYTFNSTCPSLSLEGGCSVDVTSPTRGIYLGTQGTLSVALSTLEVTMEEGNSHYALICHAIDLDRTEISTPDDASLQDGILCHANGDVVDHFVIEPIQYDLWVGDAQVTVFNASDVLGNGTASYDALSNTLYLNGLSIFADASYGIWSQMPGLTINLVGDNIISTTGRECIMSVSSDLNIVGVGVLTLNSNYRGIYVNGGDLNIEGTCTIDINSSGYDAVYVDNGDLTISGACNLAFNSTNDNGIMVFHGDMSIADGSHVVASGSCGIYGSANQTLSISRAFVTANGSSSYRGSIGGFSDVVLEGVAVSSPTGIAYNTTNCTYQYDQGTGSVVTGDIVIEPVNFNLWLVGTQVTGLNMNHLSELPGVSGTVTFDPYGPTLTLNNASIVNESYEYYYCIKSGIEDLTIVLVGENTLDGTNGDGIQLSADATISGTGSLSFNNDVCIFAYANNSVYPSLTLDGGCHIDASVFHNGISLWRTNGNVSEGGVLTVNDATLDVTTIDTQSAALQCRQLVLNGPVVTTPDPFGFNDNHQMVNGNGNVANHVVIETVKYNLWVAGIQVTSINAANITGEGISGSVSYDAENKVLTLTNANLTDAEYGVETNVHDLVINLIGTNSIDASIDGLSLYDNTTITGGGTLDITASYGIWSYDDEGRNSSLTIEGGSTVNITSTWTGVRLGSDESYLGGTLTVDHSILNVTTINDFPCYGGMGLVMTETEISIPVGAYFQDGYVRDVNGNRVCGHLSITPGVPYDLWVAGIQVTSANAANITGSGITGSVSYDAANQILTLDNATVVSSGGSTDMECSGIYNDGVDGLKISLIGVNSITAPTSNTKECGVFSKKNLTVQGTGKLTTTGYYGIRLTFGDLTITGGCEVVGNGNSPALYGSSSYYLFIVGSKVTANSPNQYPILGYSALVLTETEITTPVGAEWDYSNRRLDLNGYPVRNQVVIEPWNVFTGAEDTDWSNANNWSRGVLPVATNKVIIGSNCLVDANATVDEIRVQSGNSMTIPTGVTLTAPTISNLATSGVVIQDGAQLYCNNSPLVDYYKTFATTNIDTEGWNLMAFPMTAISIYFSDPTTYDFYYYDEDNDQQEWRNYRQSTSGFSFTPGSGFLYSRISSSGDPYTLRVRGYLMNSSPGVTINLSYGAQNADIRGYNLIGNPYPRNLTMSEVKIDGQPITEYYRLVEGENGSEFVRCTDGVIQSGEAFFVRATAEGQVLTIERE